MSALAKWCNNIATRDGIRRPDDIFTAASLRLIVVRDLKVPHPALLHWQI
jgi:hypothetical protein